MKILLAVDGSKSALDAVRCLVEHADWYREKPAVELVTVHLPVPKLPGMGAAVGKRQIDQYYAEEGDARLSEAKRTLEAAHIHYQAHVLVGDVGESIVEHAKKKRCDIIYIGTRGRSALGRALLGSTAIKVLNISDIPVLLVK